MAKRRARRNTQRRAADAVRNQRIFALRLEGWSAEAIGAEIGMSRSNVSRIIADYIEQLPMEGAKRLRRIELARYEELYRWSAGLAKEGPPGQKLAAIDRMIHISERRSKLMGLDAAEKFAVRGDLSVATMPLEKVLALYSASGRPMESLPPAVQERMLAAANAAPVDAEPSESSETPSVGESDDAE